MKPVRSKLMLILGIVLAVILLIELYFVQPFSPLKFDFNKKVKAVVAGMQLEADTFTREDIAGLPIPVQKYFISCGYIGTPKMSYMSAEFHDANFVTDPHQPALKIDYTQYDFVKEPVRLAFIDSSRLGIPFQGADCYLNGVGSMQGVIAKTITLFNQKGPEMDKASLVTILSECLIVPNVALQKYITWQAIDETHAQATIAYYGISASGIFTFSGDGEMRSFTTEDRVAVDFNGNKRKIRWSAICDDYRDNNGIRQPTTLQAIWHYPEGDVTYFNGENAQIEFH